MKNEFKRLWKNEVIGGQKVTTVRVKILPKIVDERIILQDNIVLIHDGITSKNEKYKNKYLCFNFYWNSRMQIMLTNCLLHICI